MPFIPFAVRIFFVLLLPSMAKTAIISGGATVIDYAKKKLYLKVE